MKTQLTKKTLLRAKLLLETFGTDYFTNTTAWYVLKKLEPKITKPATSAFVSKLTGFVYGSADDERLWKKHEYYHEFIHAPQSIDETKLDRKLAKQIQIQGEYANKHIHHECGDPTIFCFTETGKKLLLQIIYNEEITAVKLVPSQLIEEALLKRKTPFSQQSIINEFGCTRNLASKVIMYLEWCNGSRFKALITQTWNEDHDYRFYTEEELIRNAKLA